MKKSIIFSIAAVCAAAVLPAAAAGEVSAEPRGLMPDNQNTTVRIYPDGQSVNISPYIYGINDLGNISGTEPTVLRQCDKALSSYNWETNFSNTGIEGLNTNGIALIEKYPDSKWNDPALYTDILVTNAFLYDIPVKLVNLQLMGYVAKDAMGVVSENDNISDRWDKVSFRKGYSYLNIPDNSDETIYEDEYVAYLVNKYGTSSEGGINGYFLDSEPDLWNERFPVLKLGDLDPDELIANSAQLSSAVNIMDGNALVFGPSVSGAAAAVDLNGTFRHDLSFIEYYLSSMRTESAECGMRLLDVLDIHFYTEAEDSSGKKILGRSGISADAVRVQSVRALWDSNYNENNSLYEKYGKYMPLIPFMESAVDDYFPNTKLSFSEYSFGGGDNISGCAAEADALGVFAENGVYLACLMPDEADSSFQKAAISIYTDYDSKGSAFGNRLVPCDNGNDTTSSCYAALNGNDRSLLTIVLINKNSYLDKNFFININSEDEYTSAEVYAVKKDSPDIVRLDDIENITENQFEITLEPYSVCLVALKAPDARQYEDDKVIVTTAPAETANIPSGITSGNIAESTVEIVTSRTADVTETSPVTDTETVLSDVIAETTVSTSVVYRFSETSSSADPVPEPERKVPGTVKVLVAAMAVGCFLTALFVLFFYR